MRNQELDIEKKLEEISKCMSTVESWNATKAVNGNMSDEIFQRPEDWAARSLMSRANVIETGNMRPVFINAKKTRRESGPARHTHRAFERLASSGLCRRWGDKLTKNPLTATILLEDRILGYSDGQVCTFTAFAVDKIDEALRRMTKLYAELP